MKEPLTQKPYWEWNGMILMDLEGRLDDAQRKELHEQLNQDAEFRQYFVEFVGMCGILRQYDQLCNGECPAGEDFDEQLWDALAEDEKHAPGIDIPKEEPRRELIQKVVYPKREKQKMSQFAVFTLALSAAAVLFFVLFLTVVPAKQYSIEVATLVDQIGVQWGSPEVTLKTGSRLRTHETPLYLHKGTVKVRHDDGIDVLIEAPAVFQLERTGVFLEYGRLYCIVAESGRGFKVETPTSQFIDHGTEFGILADVNGSSELHVMKGSVQLFAGKEGGGKTGRMVFGNAAVRFDVHRGQVAPIAFKPQAFIRDIDSKAAVVWRGETLSPVVQGGLMTWTGGGDGVSTFQGANWTLGGGAVAAPTIIGNTAVLHDMQVNDPTAKVGGIGASGGNWVIGDGRTLTVTAGEVKMADWSGGKGILGVNGGVPSYVVITGGIVRTQFLQSDLLITLGGGGELRITGGDNPISDGAAIDLTSDGAVLHFTTVTADDFIAEHLGKVTVNGSPAVVDENISVVSDDGTGCYVRIADTRQTRFQRSFDGGGVILEGSARYPAWVAPHRYSFVLRVHG